MATITAAPQVELAPFHNELEKPLFISSEIEIASEHSEDEQNELFEPEYIVSSPYEDPSHQLDLQTLSDPVAALAKALTSMTAVRSDYATAAYDQSFNWDVIASSFKQLSMTATSAWPASISFFVIVFRSKLKIGAGRDLLGRLDQAAHLEAVESGGLLKYWFGKPDTDQRNLATCLWRARDDARAGGAGSGHAAAMTAARTMYDEWFVERLRLTIDLPSGRWAFSPWIDESTPAHA